MPARKINSASSSVLLVSSLWFLTNLISHWTCGRTSLHVSQDCHPWPCWGPTSLHVFGKLYDKSRVAAFKKKIASSFDRREKTAVCTSRWTDRVFWKEERFKSDSLSNAATASPKLLRGQKSDTAELCCRSAPTPTGRTRIARDHL